MPGASAGQAGGFGAQFAKDTMLSRGIGTATTAATSAGGFNPLQLMMAVSSLGTFASAYSQSKAQRAEGDFNASIYESNARLQALQAEDAIIRGDKEAVKAKQAAKRLIGSQRAAMGAQGIDLESGSALDIQQETASLGAEEALNIKNNAWREAWGYRSQEADYKARAKYAKITGRSTAKNTLLTGGLTVAKNLATYSYMNKNRGSEIDDYLSERFA
jgi:hypothetical protein